MNKRTFVLRLSVLASAIALVAGCGGGGGGNQDTPAPTATAGTIGGVAAKGFLKGAKVSAFCGNSEAVADLLVAGVTGTAGEYSLKWTIPCAKPLKLVVELGTATTMADEATGKDVTPPAGFKLRALVADPTTTTKHITPFTDMAVEIAGTAATKAAILNAESAIIKNVLGGDINAYQAMPVAPTALAMIAASADERKLATLLTLVSAFAQDNAICKLKATDGDKIKCATDTFAAQAKATVTAVSDTGYTVATTVPTDTPASMLAATLVNLTAGTIVGVTATNLSTDIMSDVSGSAAMLTSAESAVMTAAASTGGTVVVDATKDTGIQAARNLFNSLKTDLLALSNGNGSGFLDQKLSAAQTDWSTNGHASATGLMEYMKALERATQMASDAKTWTAPATSGLLANAAYPVSGHSDLILVTDSAGAPHQFIRYFASFIDGNQTLAMNCRVNVSDMALGKAGCVYGYGKADVTDTAAGSITRYFRRVQVAEGTTSGSFGWQDAYATRAISSTQHYAVQGTIFIPVVSTQGLLTQANFALAAASLLPLADAVNDAAPLTGTAARTLDSITGDIAALSLKGEVQPLATGQDKSTLDISAALTSTSTTQTADLTGTITNVTGGVATLTMAIASGSQIVFALPTATSFDHATLINFVTQIKTTGFQYDGTLTIDTFTAELGNGNFQPANASFTGKVSTVANGTATEFLNGTLGMKQTNLAAFDPTIAISASNFLKQTASFSGKVTNGTATYELTFIGDGSTYAQESVTLNYTRSGTQMISFTSTKSATVNTITLSGSGNVNAVLDHEIGDVLVGTTKVGTITKNPSQVNFIDGTYLLLGA